MNKEREERAIGLPPEVGKNPCPTNWPVKGKGAHLN